MDDVYVLRTHYVDEDITRLYEEYTKEFGQDNVYILLDITNIKETINNLKVKNIIIINKDIAQSLNSLFRKHPNNNGFNYRFEESIVHAYESIKLKRDIKYMWLIEYDVRWIGSLKDILLPCLEIKCDFLAKGNDKNCSKKLYKENKSWCWWCGLYGEIDKTTKMDERVGCFTPITRYSESMIKALRNNFEKSTGFCEVYLPCVCLQYNLEYACIPEKCFDKFHFRPTMKKEEMVKKNKLYHPVK